MIREFYQGKRVLLTGHTGFKGTWLSLILEYMGATVCGFSLPAGGRPGFYQEAAPAIARSLAGDIRSREDIQSAIADFKPEIVIHLASHSSLDKVKEWTHYIFETNLMGVVNLLEGLRESKKTKAVLVVTSDKCYQDMETQIPYREDSRLGGRDPYSASKACQEYITECYRASFFSEALPAIRTATARASNILGWGDSNDRRLFPYLLRCFMNRETALIRNPQIIRPWQNILDVLYGYLLLCKALCEAKDAGGDICSAFNFGPGEDGFITVEELTKSLSGFFPGSSYQIVPAENEVKETSILKLDSGRAEKMLGWRRGYSLRDTIKQTADIAERISSGQNPHDVCMSEVKRYFERK